MKKLLIIAFFCILGNIGYAQNYPANYAAQIGSTRTLTNAQPDTINVTINGARPDIAFKYDITKTSGTLSGTIVLLARMTTADAWATLNTYTITDATATNSVLLTANHYTYYRVITTPGSSQVAVYKKYLTYRGY